MRRRGFLAGLLVAPAAVRVPAAPAAARSVSYRFVANGAYLKTVGGMGPELFMPGTTDARDVVMKLTDHAGAIRRWLHAQQPIPAHNDEGQGVRLADGSEHGSLNGRDDDGAGDCS
ncbi:MAG: hypothetical protein U1E23_14700 [Reyranellaceae bacterium]